MHWWNPPHIIPLIELVKADETTEETSAAVGFGTVVKAVPGFRYPVLGPFETADLGGLDTFYYISSYLFNELSDEKKPTRLQQELMDNNILGVKSGKGCYDYSEGKGEEAMARRDKNFFKMLKHIHKD